MREITDTTNKYADQEIPDGARIFRVVSIEKRYGKSTGAEFFVWRLAYEGGEGEQILMPNMMGPLLRVLGCKETEPNKFDWDTTEQTDKAFSATVSRKPDRKDPTKMRQIMSEFDAVKAETIPF